MKSFEVVKSLKELITEQDIIVSSNGNISREAYHYLPKPQIYLRGSMGLPVSVGLGVALANPNKRVLVITGDGNFLMGFGSTVTASFYKTKNLKVLILDNEKYFTTGGQKTVSRTINYTKFFEGLNILISNSKEASPNEIKNDLSQLLNSKAFSVLHLVIDEGKEKLQNIPWHPEEITQRFIARLIEE